MPISELSNVMIRVRSGKAEAGPFSGLPNPWQAREMLQRPDVVGHLKSAANLTAVAAPTLKEISVRDLLLISGLPQDASHGIADLNQLLAKEDEPPLSLTDFGHPVLDNEKAVVLTNTPVFLAIRGILGNPDIGHPYKTAHPAGFIAPEAFLHVKEYFNILMGRQFCYPGDGVGQQINFSSPNFLQSNGIDGLFLGRRERREDEFFYSFRDDRHVWMRDLPVGKIPRLAVVLVDAEYNAHH
jgi:hypothetical protein